MPSSISLQGKSGLKEIQDVRAANKNFIELFREQVNNNPKAISVVCKGESLSYGELDKKSDLVAKHLRAKGIKNEDLVGLCVSLSSNFVICLLGILKAGGGYFPLDAAYPKERLLYMLEDGKPAAILVEEQFAYLFKNQKTIKIEKKIFDAWESSKRPLNDIEIDPDHLAYVIYTSGSTGNPKGIMVTHRSLPNIAQAHNAYYPSNMRMLLSGGVCFDASLLVIFHALINGEALYLFDYHPKDDIDLLFEFLESNSVEYMIGVPSQYSRLLQKNRKLGFLKCVSLTGENLPRSLCELHAKLAPNALLYNEYGPTECAIGTTIAKIYDPKDRIVRDITVGKALPNTQVYILDQNLKQVSKGAKGEICIGGIGLARGYLNKDKLTAEKFVWASLPGQKPIRLYRTGDIGRILPNGLLEFLGRVDNNAQVCGNTISIGEVEYHISRYPDVQESAVLVEPNPKGVKQLVAYVTSKNASVKKSLKGYLEKHMPKQMIPSRIIHIRKFPLSPNGKIDRDALSTIRH